MAQAPEWAQVKDAIASGYVARISDLLEPYETSDLKGLVTPLKQLHTEVRRLVQTQYDKGRRQCGPLLFAALISAQTPVQAASWVTKQQLLGAHWYYAQNAADSADYGTLLAVLSAPRREDDWTADLACRLAAGMRTTPDRVLWDFTHRLAERSHAAVPLTDGYVAGWVFAASAAPFERMREHPRTPEKDDNDEPAPSALLSWLRGEPRLAEHIGRMFEIPDLGGEFEDRNAVGWAEGEHWTKVLAVLCAEGRLARGDVIDGCAARMLSSDRLGSIRGHVLVHEAIAPTPLEVGERLPTYLSMATSAVGPAAKVAQQALRRLDAATPIEPDTLARLSADVFSRAENALVNQQLVWIDGRIKADPDTAAILLPTLATAFTHPAVPVQQRALKLAAKHLRLASPDVLSTLRQGAEAVDPALRDEARRALATTPDHQTTAAAATTAPTTPATPTPDTEIPPAVLPPYQPAAMPPALESVGELVTAFTPVLANTDIAPLEVERLMEAVAVHTDCDRRALIDALAPLRTTYPPHPIHATPSGLSGFRDTLRRLFDAALREDHTRRTGHFYHGFNEIDRPPMTALLLRVNELIDVLLGKQTVPLLLATPTAPSGAIDPDVLLARLTTYRERGIRPLHHDLQQALMRTADTGNERLRAMLKGLPTLPAPLPTLDDYLDQAPAFGRNLMPYARPLGVPSSSRPEKLRPKRSETGPYWILVPPYNPDNKAAFPAMGWEHWCEYWPTMLPHHPELLAAHAIPVLYHRSNEAGSHGSTIFPQFAETAGAPGPIAHLALAYGLAADRLSDRVATADTVITFASRGLLRPELLGRAAAELWHREMLRPNRLTASLQEVEQAGATTHVFTAACAAIAVLAATPELRGLPELLLLATRCAVGAGISGAEVPGLAELAAVKKPVRVGREARRLTEALAP